MMTILVCHIAKGITCLLLRHIILLSFISGPLCGCLVCLMGVAVIVAAGMHDNNAGSDVTVW